MTWAQLEEDQGNSVRAEEIRNLYFQQVSSQHNSSYVVLLNCNPWSNIVLQLYCVLFSICEGLVCLL